MGDFEVVGLAHLREVAVHVKATGDRGVRNALAKSLRSATLPLEAALRESALATLPKRGGLNEVVARSKITTQLLTSARTTAVRVKIANADNIRRINEGEVRHPVFGRWVKNMPAQHVTPGWATTPFEAAEAPITEAVFMALEETINEIR